MFLNTKVNPSHEKRKSHMLWTAPRCVGTAFELMVESRGDFQIEVNLFDSVFYFVDRLGLDKPRAAPSAELESFESIFHRQVELRKHEAVFYRNAAYTAIGHVGEVNWSNLNHTFLIRDPRKALPSHKKFVETITVEEAGYVAQYALYEFLARSTSRRPIVIDADDLLRDPAAIVESWCRVSGLDFIPSSLSWRPGFRSRWGLWKEWKAEVATSSGFISPQTTEIEFDLEGIDKDLLETCLNYYRALHKHRIQGRIS